MAWVLNPPLCLLVLFTAAANRSPTFKTSIGGEASRRACKTHEHTSYAGMREWASHSVTKGWNAPKWHYRLESRAATIRFLFYPWQQFLSRTVTVMSAGDDYTLVCATVMHAVANEWCEVRLIREERIAYLFKSVHRIIHAACLDIIFCFGYDDKAACAAAKIWLKGQIFA